LSCFYFWPTSTSGLYKPSGAGLAWLNGIDLAGNACPSLHVAATIFSWAWLRRQLAQAGAGRSWQVANLVWALAIIFSTLATKQHAAWDVFGGVVLGGLGAAASLAALRLPGISTRLRFSVRSAD
jgi:hypothetical protein